MVADFGKYSPNLTFIIPDEWTEDGKGNVESPIQWREVSELTGNMNVDFDAREVSVLFGEAFTSKNGGWMFKITSATKAKDVLVSADWGGCFNHTRGQNVEYAKKIGARYFRRASSNGGGAGCDYYILPVNFVAFSDNRDVTKILSDVDSEEARRVSSNERKLKEAEEAAKTSAAGREKYLPLISSVLEKLKTICDKWNCYFAEWEAKEDFLVGDGKRPYNQETLGYFEEKLKKYQEAEAARAAFASEFEELKPVVEGLGYKLELGLFEARIKKEWAPTFEYTEAGLTAFRVEVDKLYSARKAEEEKARAVARALVERFKRDKQEEEACALGYPKDFTFYHRESGKINQACAYVLEPNGNLRLNDSLDYRNLNHSYSRGIHSADGVMHWKQILPGELVVAFTKEYSAAPLEMTLQWVPNEVTPAQMETLRELTSELEERYQKYPEVSWEELLETATPSQLNPPA